MKKIVLFDIDYALFDVSYFDKNFYQELSPIIGIEKDVLRNKAIEIIVKLVKEEDYLDIDKFTETLLVAFNKKEYINKVEELLFRSSFFKNGIYKEVHKVLLNLKGVVDIGVFSQGDPKLQWAKIEQSGFGDLFKEELKYIIKPRKLDFVPSLVKYHMNDKVYLIDDKLKVIKEVKEKMPDAIGIWIKRGPFAENETLDFKPDATILNLSEIIPIILNS